GKDMEIEITIGVRAPAGVGFTGFMRPEEGSEGKGLRLGDFVADSPAEKAGFKTGDVVTKINDKAIDGIGDYFELASSSRAGDKWKVTVSRGTEVKVIDLTLGERPAGGPGGGFGGPGGATRTRPYSANYAGQRENVQEQQGAEGFQYGGVYKSTD